MCTYKFQEVIEEFCLAGHWFWSSCTQNLVKHGSWDGKLSAGIV